ncbi:MAG: hypothetical protein R3C10_23815 [Pirellulales bacterium]
MLRYKMRDYADDATAIATLLGSEAAAGRMVGAVKANPYYVIIIEDIEATPPRLQELLARIFSNGVIQDPQSGSKVDFKNCVFFLLTTASHQELANVATKSSGRRERIHNVLQTFQSETMVEGPLLAQICDVFVLTKPSNMVAAEVILLLMQRECERHKLKLEYVDPQLIAEEVRQSQGAAGFGPMPARIGRLMRDPLVRAAQSSQTALSLRRNEITMVHQPELD